MIAYDLLAVIIDIITFNVKTESKKEQWSPSFAIKIGHTKKPPFLFNGGWFVNIAGTSIDFYTR